MRIAAQGDGITESGRHVALTAPGDIVEASGRIVPGPQHVTPPCRHFPACGGCDLQHVALPAYAAFLRERIVNALAGQGVACEVVADTILSDPRSRRRASLKALRTQGRWIIGFAERGSKQIVDLTQCAILASELFALIAPLRQFLAQTGQGSKAVEIVMTLVDSGVDLLLKGLKADGLRSAEALILFAQRHRLARLSVDEGFGPETRWEPQPVTITLGGVAVPFGHQAFLQATCSGEQALIAAVQQWAVGERIADLFAGLGTFSLTQKPTTKLYAAEADRAAITNLAAAGRQAGRQIFTDHRDLFRRPLQPAELNRFTTVILDPPRAGARDQVAQLAKSELANLIYVSCNPSSFARDAKQLRDGGFRLRHIQPVGQFLWSTHVELAAHFVR